MINSNLREVGYAAFYKNPNGTKLSSLIFPMSLKIIDEHAFGYNKKLRLVSIPYDFETIASNAFEHCKVIPDENKAEKSHENLHIRLPNKLLETISGEITEAKLKSLFNLSDDNVKTKYMGLRTVFGIGNYYLRMRICDETDQKVLQGNTGFILAVPLKQTDPWIIETDIIQS